MPADTDIADPAPLGLTGFGLTTFMVGMLEAGLLSSGAIGVIIPLAIAYGGTIQLFAGLLAFRGGNTFATTAFCIYGAFWWWFALVEWLGASLGMFAVPTVALGWVLIGFGVITTYLWVSTFKLNWASGPCSSRWRARTTCWESATCSASPSSAPPVATSPSSPRSSRCTSPSPR